MLWVRISIRARCPPLCDKVCQWLATGQWFSPGSPVSSTNQTDCHHIPEISLKVALNTINKQKLCIVTWYIYCFRILEQYILYGNKSDVLESVIEELSNPKRTNPQDLDKALAGQLREVLNSKEMDHQTAAKKFRIDWGSYSVSLNIVLWKNVRLYLFQMKNPQQTKRNHLCTLFRPQTLW